MIKLLKKNTSLYAVWLVMLALISVGVATTNVLSVVALIIFAAFLLIYPIEKSCVLLFGIMPFANIFKYTPETTSFFTICELLLVVVSFLKVRKIKFSFIISLMILAGYMFITDVPNNNILGIVKIVVGFYLIFLVTSKANKDDAINIAYLLSGSTILMLLVTMNGSYFNYIEPYLLDLNYVLDSTGIATETLRMGGFLGDPNYCGVLILVSVAFLCTLYYYKKIKAEFWVFIAFLIPLGFFTYSKTYFLCVSALALFLILFVLFPKHKFWSIVSIIVLSVIVTMAISGRFETINAIIGRFVNEDFTTGRAELSRIYLDYIWNTPSTLFFGEGISTVNLASVRKGVHNIYIEALFKFGLFGIVLYLVSMLTGVDFTKRKKGERKIANYFPLIFIAVAQAALDGITMYALPFYLAIAFLAINFASLNESEKNI